MVLAAWRPNLVQRLYMAATKFVRFTLAAFVQPYVCALAVHKFHATSLELLAHCFFPDKRLAVCLDLLNGSWTHFS